eukprot:2462077-Pyramimonas_sp.AAC.1
MCIRDSLGSSAYFEPEMTKTQELARKGLLLECTPHGCELGYADVETKEPHYKPMRFLTTSVAIYAALQDEKCSRDHYRLPLGNQKKTRAAAKWPDKLDRLVLHAIEQQIDLD